MGSNSLLFYRQKYRVGRQERGKGLPLVHHYAIGEDGEVTGGTNGIAGVGSRKKLGQKTSIRAIHGVQGVIDAQGVFYEDSRITR